ncbi:MAG: hypothetical protein H0X67_07495 [Acidobacteria bacterium]|nr:hypothetical protein [Acidobacteriota bacterium]
MPIHWSSFDGFTPPVERRTLTWEGVVAWIARLESQLGAERRFVAARRAESDTQLQDLGGDPTAHD